MPDFNTPTVDDLYVDWETQLQDHFASQAKMFDDGVTWTNLPTNAIRWNSSNSRFEKWSGAAWANLSAALTDVCKTANNLSDLASAATARTNLGLGTIAVENSPLPLNKGGTGDTTASGARTNLGLGTIATQAASAVAITGGTLSGITALTMTSASTLDFTSGGTITKCGTFTNTNDINIVTTTGDYYIYLKTNNITRVIVNVNGIQLGANNTYDIGSGSVATRDIFMAGKLYTTQINAAADINVMMSATTYWVFGNLAKDFRPNTNATQNLGGSSFRWSTLYVDSINGAQTSIHLSDSSDVHIRYLANLNGDHKFYHNLGAQEVYRIESTGKLNPIVVGRHDYTTSTGVRRTISTGDSLANVVDTVGTIVSDLIAHGLFQ